MHVMTRSEGFRNWRSRIIIAVLGLVCLIVLALLADLMWTLRSADNCFRSLEAFTPGKTTLSEAQVLLRYQPFVYKSGPCSEQDCTIAFYFEERVSWWGLIRPRRGFQGFVHIRNGTVATVHFSYLEGVTMSVSVTEGLKEFNPGMPFDLSVTTWDARKNKSIARIRDFDDLPIDSRRKVLQPNVWCLVRLSGCQDVRVIVPGSSSLNFVNQN